MNSNNIWQLVWVEPEKVVEPTIETTQEQKLEVSTEEGETLAEYAANKFNEEDVKRAQKIKDEELDLPEPEILTKKEIEEKAEEFVEELNNALDNVENEDDLEKVRKVYERVVAEWEMKEHQYTNQIKSLTKKFELIERENETLQEENAKMKYGKKSSNEEVNKYEYLVKEYKKETNKESINDLIKWHMAEIKSYAPNDFDEREVAKMMKENAMKRISGVSNGGVWALINREVEKPGAGKILWIPIKKK